VCVSNRLGGCAGWAHRLGGRGFKINRLPVAFRERIDFRLWVCSPFDQRDREGVGNRTNARLVCVREMGEGSRKALGSAGWGRNAWEGAGETVRGCGIGSRRRGGRDASPPKPSYPPLLTMVIARFLQNKEKMRNYLFLWGGVGAESPAKHFCLFLQKISNV